jgi:hypothetical protein
MLNTLNKFTDHSFRSLHFASGRFRIEAFIRELAKVAFVRMVSAWPPATSFGLPLVPPSSSLIRLGDSLVMGLFVFLVCGTATMA